MVRTQVYLTPEEHAGLKELAAQEGASQSELIRQAVDQFIAQRQQPDWKAQLLAMAGCLADKTDWPGIESMRLESDFRF